MTVRRSSMRDVCRKLYGFTLMELLLALAIILIIAGAIAPRLDFGFQKHRLDADIKKLASNIELARQYAISQRDSCRYYGIVFYKNYYRIIQYDDEKNPKSPVVAPTSVNTNGDIPLSKGVSASGAKDVIFDSRGSISGAGDIQIILQNNAGKRTITVKGLTGYIEIM